MNEKKECPRMPTDQELSELSEEGAIARMQAYRWEMLKGFHAFKNIRMSTKHLFMDGQIELLRGGERQLFKIWLRKSFTENNFKQWRKNLQPLQPK